MPRGIVVCGQLSMCGVHYPQQALDNALAAKLVEIDAIGLWLAIALTTIQLCGIFDNTA